MVVFSKVHTQINGITNACKLKVLYNPVYSDTLKLHIALSRDITRIFFMGVLRDGARTVRHLLCNDVTLKVDKLVNCLGLFLNQHVHMNLGFTCG